MHSILLSNSSTASGVHRTRPSTGAPQTGRWRVIHACEYPRDILLLLEGQVATGMHPYIVTPQGAGTAELYLTKNDLEQPENLSLLRAWQDVRNWRKSLLGCNPENASDLVHAHSFASGMAAVRNLSCVVYDLKACIEEFAISAGLCEAGSWMGRSFRVAEQFILSRAQAVIVHSQGMKTAAEERGAAPENVFLVPDPLPLNSDEHPQTQPNSFLEYGGGDTDAVSYFVPMVNQWNLEHLPPGRESVLEAFALTVAEAPSSRLWIGASASSIPAIRGYAERLGISEHVVPVEEKDAAVAMENTTVVVATGELPDDPVKIRLANEICLAAMATGKPLLAADVPRNRDGSPEGRGCLWFTEGDVRDLGLRMAFLNCHPDFRASLAASARAYIHETRNSAAIGQRYAAAYRHAISRKKTGGPGQAALTLLLVACAL